jgi:hypothetical protein
MVNDRLLVDVSLCTPKVSFVHYSRMFVFPDGNVPEALASGGYGALPTGIVASFNAMNANTSSPSPNSRNVAVASAARPITNSNSGYAQLPGGGPIDVPPTPGARPYTGMPATNQKPTSRVDVSLS